MPFALHWTCIVAVVAACNAFAADTSSYHPASKPVELTSHGAGEGPAWHPDGYLLSSGEGNINKYQPAGKPSVFRENAGSNGILIDSQRRIVICESSRRRVTRIELDGSLTVLADQLQGKKFNTPNDLTIDSKGRIYFSDPRYGRRDDMEMRDEQGRFVEGVYRIDGPGQVTRVIGQDVERANGVFVAAGDQYLYVADNNNNNVGGARKLWRFDLRPDGSVRPGSRHLVFDWKDARGPDGLKMDQEGRFYVAAGLNKANPPYETADKLKGGLYILSPAGRLLEFIPIPNDEVTNCAFGGEDLKTVFITAGGHLWSVRVQTPGRMSYLAQ